MDLHAAIAEIQQPRSRYQLERFIVGAHDTDEMRFYQCVIELNDRLHKFKVATINQRRMERRIGRLDDSDDLDADLDIEEAQAELDFLLGVMAGAERELRDLLDIYDAIPHFTRDEIDTNQADYWEKRMTRQTHMQVLAGSVQPAQLDALAQVGLLGALIAEPTALEGIA